MAFLNFGKKKEAPCACCSGTQNAPTGRILVLGACCQRSADTFANVKQAAAELGLPDEVENTGDPVEIAKYGVMQTPALVVDGKVLAYGRLLSVAEAKKLLEGS